MDCCPGNHPMMLFCWVHLRRVVFISQPIIQAKVFRDFPCVLREKIELVAAYSVGGAGELKIIIEESADKIGERISCVAPTLYRRNSCRYCKNRS